MFKISRPLLGLKLQTELAIMTFLDAISSLRDWSPPFKWAEQIDHIWNTTISQTNTGRNYDQYIKIVLSWIVVSRMVIAHLYTATCAANLYTILTWCRGKILLPWLMLSAFKNFFLESIVVLVVILLYLEGNLSGFLFLSIIVDKLISAVIAVHSWFSINSLYRDLVRRNPRERMTEHRKSTSPNVVLGMSLHSSELNDNIDTFNSIISLPHLDYLDIDFPLEFDPKPSELISTTSMFTNSESTEHQDEFYVNNIDDSELTTAEKSLRILGISIDNIEPANNKPTLPEINEKLLPSSATTITSTQLDDNNDTTSLTCGCLIYENENKDDETPKINCDLPAQDDQSNVSENKYSNKYIDDIKWTNQWSLEQLLQCKKLNPSNEEDQASLPIIFEDYFPEYSSDEFNAIINSINDENIHNNVDNSKRKYAIHLPDFSSAQIKNFDYNKQSSQSWIEHLQIVDNSFETTLQSQWDNHFPHKITDIDNNSEDSPREDTRDIKIRRILILNDPLYLIEKQNIFMKSQINSFSTCGVATQTTIQTSSRNSSLIEMDNNNETFHTSSAIQTSIHDVIPKNSYYQSLSMYNPVINKYRIHETINEREQKELLALKSYNARTLWKDKEKNDIKKLKFIPGGESNLLGNSQSLKSHTDNILFKRKQRHQTKNINGLKQVSENLKINPVSCKKIQVSHVGRHLNRIKASENIPRHYLMRSLSKSTNVEHRNKKISPVTTSQLILSSPRNSDIKNKIAQLDWTISSWKFNFIHDNSLNKSTVSSELAILDIIDENDTVELLQNAFSFDSHNPQRGFYLGPASTDFYSLSEQIPNVFHEIIKSTRIPTVHNDCNNLSTNEIDYGETYYEELITIDSSDDILDSQNDSDIYSINYWMKKLPELSLDIDENHQDSERSDTLSQIPGLFILRQLINNLYSSMMVSVSTATSRISIPVRQSPNTSTVTLDNSTK